MIRYSIKISAKESLGYNWLKKNKPWFDGECSNLIDQRKHYKLQWLQNPSQVNGDNLKKFRLETIGIFRKKKSKYLKGKIIELETNIKQKY
jgi:hypothetical protein